MVTILLAPWFAWSSIGFLLIYGHAPWPCHHGQQPGRDIGLETSACACFEAHVTWPRMEHIFLRKAPWFCLVLCIDVIGAIITNNSPNNNKSILYFVLFAWICIDVLMLLGGFLLLFVNICYNLMFADFVVNEGKCTTEISFGCGLQKLIWPGNRRFCFVLSNRVQGVYQMYPNVISNE